MNKVGRLLALAAAGLMTTTAMSSAASMDDLVKAAKAEGQLTTIALPHDWCGYGDIIAGFKKKYGIKVNELNPDAGSGDEVEAIKANKNNKGPQAPDVVDVGLSFGPKAKADDLLMPYKVSTWDQIPDSAKDADGYWYGDYYGVMAFEVNKDLVKQSPQDWPDLTDKQYANSVALAGDPRTAAQAIMGVYGAGLSKGGKDGAKIASDGLDFYAAAQQGRQFRAGDRQVGDARPGHDADHRALGLPGARRPRQPEGQSRRWTSSCRRRASSPASTCRRSANTRRIRTRRSCGWSISTRTRASSAG